MYKRKIFEYLRNIDGVNTLDNFVYRLIEQIDDHDPVNQNY
jgi:hypothetical protein